MRKKIPLHFFSRLLLLVMLTAMGNGVHESAHAMHAHVTAPREQALQPDISESHQCPCVPLEQHKDCDDCDKCVSCSCHAPLTIQQFQMSYNPIIMDLNRFDQFNFLPEVYLSLFVPPDSAAV